MQSKLLMMSQLLTIGIVFCSFLSCFIVYITKFCVYIVYILIRKNLGREKARNEGK